MSGNVFIVGKNSFIAKRISAEKLSNFDNIIYTSSTSSGDALVLNLETPEKFNYQLINKNDIVLLFASISSPDVCQKKPDLAYNINVTGTVRFIDSALRRNARIIFFSSDTVYGEAEAAVDENSSANPIGAYAVMKYSVEKEFLNERNFKVFRLSYVYSRDDKYTSYLKKCTENNTIAEIYHPIFRNVIFIDDVVDATVLLVFRWEEFKNQLFNICGPHLLSRLDIANLYKDQVDPTLQMKVVKPDRDYYSARPKTIQMKSLYLENLLGRKPAPIVEAIKLEFKQ